MSSKQYFLTAALVAAALFAGRALAPFVTFAPQAAAQTRPDSEREDEKTEGDPAGRRWEYCAVTRAQYLTSTRGGVYWIVYFRDRGVQVVDVEVPPGGNAFARAVARLGEEGWEMTGEGDLEVRPGGPAPRAIFFKRLKS
ncbi:MAG TPA: hypothetical protein VFX96_14810 [Pyrinomonadaceae bacterium]|nr:hypothetical protein [Pyrinomonadaceae bacterium]